LPLGTRFPAAGVHPVRDTQTKRLRHVNFFRHECFREVRIPRVKLSDGRVVLAAPDWIGKLAGFTLLFEALVLAMAQQVTFAAVAKLVRGAAVAERWCAACHEIGHGRGGSVPQGRPTFPPVARSGLTADQLRAFLSHPHGAMPDLSLTRRSFPLANFFK
jgi:hypothetical protein